MGNSAIFSVFVAPRLQRRFGTAPTPYVNLAMFAVLLAIIAARIDSPPRPAVVVITSGALTSTTLSPRRR